MQSSKAIHGVILLSLLAIASVIVAYYWQIDDLDGIRVLPRYLMVLFLGYVLIQMLKRWLYRDRHWWDWLYYLGLAAAMLPTFMASQESARMFHLVTDYGTLFLIFPVLSDFYTLLKRKE